MTRSKGTTRNLATHTLAFSTSEVRRIKKAANICGWTAGESALFARHMLLRDVVAILGWSRRNPGRKA
jgi:hypothetical protein